MLLKIHKDYLDKVERYTKFGAGGKFNPYAVRYVFNLPQGSDYENYALMLDTDDYRYSDGELVIESVGANRERKGNYYYLNIEDGQRFTITRYKNREEKKRYKRYELNGAELNAIFNYNRDIEKLPYVIAEVKQYLNNGTRRSGEVISSKIAIGRSDGTWLYVDDERRKVNSKGVHVIGELPLERKDEAESIIKTFYLEKDAIYTESMHLISVAGELERISTRAHNLAIEDTSEAICKICEDKRRELKAKLDSNQERLSDIEAGVICRLTALCRLIGAIAQGASYLVSVGDNGSEKLEIPEVDVEKLEDGNIKLTVHSHKEYTLISENKKEKISGIAAKELLKSSTDKPVCNPIKKVKL